MADYSEGDRRRLGEILEPTRKIEPMGDIEDRRKEGPDMAPPYLGEWDPNQEVLFLQSLAAEAKHREENPNALQRALGIMDIKTHPSTYYTMEDLITATTPKIIRGPR